jgi:hypothetical protein
MRPLEGQNLLAAWERGLDEHPVERALTLLAAALPDGERDDLARLPLGARDALLLALHERTFGAALQAVAACPAGGAERKTSRRRPSRPRCSPPWRPASRPKPRGAEQRVELACPTCGHAWQAQLDVAEFLWAGVNTAAGRLLEDVHALAAACGWSEGDVLALSARRRRAYRELAGR